MSAADPTGAVTAGIGGAVIACHRGKSCPACRVDAGPPRHLALCGPEVALVDVDAGREESLAIRVAIADDHTLVRQGLSALISREGFLVVAEASDGRDAIALFAAHRPDLAVFDMSMPLMNGLDAAQELLRLSPSTRSILLSRHAGVDSVLAAIRAGVKGYVLKSQSACDLIQAMHDVCAGGMYLSPGISDVVVEAFRSNASFPGDLLTGRERQVLKLVAEGYSTKECAAILGVAVKTADSHRTHLMRKLSIHGTAGLVRYAVRHHIAEA